MVDKFTSADWQNTALLTIDTQKILLSQIPPSQLRVLLKLCERCARHCAAARRLRCISFFIFHFLVSTYFLKLFKIACQPSRCISIGLVFSASNVVAILVLASSSFVNITSTFLPSEIEYTINSFVFTCS